ncbi:unnamed protein product, partial [Candidula unifasciata]
MKRYLPLAALLACVRISASGARCPYKECVCDSISIVCQNRNLTRIPALISEKADEAFLLMD